MALSAGADDSDIDKITWQNACRFLNWDPFAEVPESDATVGALRARAQDVDTSIRSRKEWAALYERESGHRSGTAAGASPQP